MLVVAARSHMDGDPLTLDENLHGACGEAHLDFGAGKAVGNAVIVAIDIDVIIEARPPQPPFRVNVGLGWKRTQCRTVKLLEKLAAGQAGSGKVP